MSIKKIVKPFVPEFILEARRNRIEGIEPFLFEAKGDVKKDIREKYQYSGELADLFADNKTYMMHKWHHYIPLYDRYFSPYKGRKVRFLEIGVSKGGSLQMWRKYFGPDAVIFGIDINSDCKKLDGLSGQVRIGSQADPEFLASVVKEMGGVDVILDDGSHHMDHVAVTLKHLFPLMNDGGTYMIEDLHAAYWKRYGGGFKSKKNFFYEVGNFISDMHHWYHRRKVRKPSVSNHCTGIHIHDSIVVLEKSRVFRPVHSQSV